MPVLKEFSPGMLKHTATVNSPVRALDDHGSTKITSWSSSGTCRVGIEDLAGREIPEAGALTAQVDTRIVMWRRPTLQPENRILVDIGWAVGTPSTFTYEVVWVSQERLFTVALCRRLEV